jgi:signal transduction histidine kinase/CheY-like chemotaxis protein
MFEPPYRVLIADNEEDSRELITRLLTEEFTGLNLSVSIDTVSNIVEAKRKLKELAGEDLPFDVLVLDWRFSHRSNGGTLLKWLKEDGLGIDTEVIVLTGYLGEIPNLSESVLELGAFFYADKASVLGGDLVATSGDFGAISSKSFVFLIRNCIERLRVRREQRKVIDLVGEMHKSLTNALVLDEQLRIVVQFPKQINNKIHKASIRMPTLETDRGIELECVARDECARCLEDAYSTQTGKVLWSHQGIGGHVFRTGVEYVRNKQLLKDPLYFETCPHSRSELCLPLKVEGRVIGVLNLESPFENSFDRYEVKVMQAVAEVASPSLRNARVVKTLLRMTEQIVRKVAADGEDEDPAERVAAFDSIRLEQVAPLFKLVLEDALRLTSADYGAVCMADWEHRVLRLAAERGMGKPQMQQIGEISMDADQPRSICRLVARDGVVRRATGPSDTLWNQYAPFQEQEGKIKSFLCVPIKFGEKVFGVIDLEDQAPDKFSYLDEVVIASFANMAASALGNAALMVALKERKELIESRARLLGRADLFKMVAHDFKSPLNSLAFAFAHCRQLLDKKDFDRLRDQLNVCKQQIERASKFIDETLKLAKEDADNVKPYPNISLRRMMEDVKAEIMREFTDYEILLDPGAFDGNVGAKANPIRVQLVMKELIKNAAEVAKGRGRITIACWRDQSDVCLSFHDDGPGVPMNDHDAIFDLGYSTRGSTGQGLARARRIIELQLGSLTLDRDNTCGARFILRLPSIPLSGSPYG